MSFLCRRCHEPSSRLNGDDVCPECMAEDKRRRGPVDPEDEDVETDFDLSDN